MTASRPTCSPGSWIHRHRVGIVSFAVNSLYAVFIEWLLGWAALWREWATIGAVPVAAAAALMLLTHIVRCLRIYDYFIAEMRGQFFLLFRVTQVHNLINILLPFRAGEASFPMLMKAQFGVSMARSTSALLWMRLLDLHALLAVGGFGLVLRSGHIPTATAVWLAFCLAPLAVNALQAPLSRLSLTYAPARLHGLITEIIAGLPARWSDFLRAWFMTVLNWGIKVATIAWILHLLGVLPFAAAMGGALGGELSSVLPVHAPAGVGTYPAGITAGALSFGYAQDKAALATLAGASVNTHLLILVSALLGTGLSMLLARPGTIAPAP